MKLNEIICEDQQLDELLGGVGRAVGRGLGSLAKGYGYVAGLPKAMSAASQRGRAAAMANVGYGKFADQEENPIYKQELEKRLGTSAGGTDRVAAIQQEIQRLQGLLSAAQGQGATGGATGGTSTAPQGGTAAKTPAAATKSAGYNYKTSIPAASTTGKYSGYSSATPTSAAPTVKYNTTSGLLKPGSTAKSATPAAPAAGSTAPTGASTDFAAKRAAGAQAAQSSMIPKPTTASPSASTQTTGTDFAAKRSAGAQAAQSSMTTKSDDDLLNLFKARKSAPTTSTPTSTKFSQPKSSASVPPTTTPAASTPTAAPAAVPGKQLSDKPENVRRREKRAEQSKVQQAVKQAAGGSNWVPFQSGQKVLERRNLKER